MKASEVNREIIGKRCRCIFTAMMVSGVIEDIDITLHTAEVKVRFDEPVQWGDDLFHSTWAHARLSDEFGSLHYLEIID
jgi:acyl dehydratase